MTDYGDPLTKPFWEGAERGELWLPFCSQCGRAEWYPRPFCLACGGEPQWRRASGRGHVHSQTVVRVPVRPELEPPYVVGLIDLDEGPRFLAAVEAPPGEVAIGDRVEIAWRTRPGLPPLAVFRPVPRTPGASWRRTRTGSGATDHPQAAERRTCLPIRRTG